MRLEEDSEPRGDWDQGSTYPRCPSSHSRGLKTGSLPWASTCGGPLPAPAPKEHPGHRKQLPREFMCKTGLRVASAASQDGAESKRAALPACPVQDNRLYIQRKPRASPHLRRSLEREQGRRSLPAAILAPAPQALLATFLPAPPLPGSRRCFSFTLSLGRDTNPFAVSSQHCWDPLEFSQRTCINTRREQKGSNYRKYKQHENSQASKVQVSQSQTTTLELKTLACLPAGLEPDSSPRRPACRCTTWLPRGQGPGPRPGPPLLSFPLEDLPQP